MADYLLPIELLEQVSKGNCVFLSHRGVDKALVEALAIRRRAEGLKPFLDQWHLVPGEPWEEALEDALD